MSTQKERGHRPKKGETASQSLRAVKARESRAAAKLAREEDVLANVGGSGDFDDSPVGVVDETPMPATTQTEKHSYKCVNCREVLEFGLPECGVCEEPLNWEGIA